MREEDEKLVSYLTSNSGRGSSRTKGVALKPKEGQTPQMEDGEGGMRAGRMQDTGRRTPKGTSC